MAPSNWGSSRRPTARSATTSRRARTPPTSPARSSGASSSRTSSRSRRSTLSDAPITTKVRYWQAWGKRVPYGRKRHGRVRGQTRSSTQTRTPLTADARKPDGLAPATERSLAFVYNDKNLTCADCGQEFVFTASEQDFYAQRGFTEPRRCPSCRASRKAARNAEGGGSSYGGYGAGGGYSAGGLELRWQRWLRLPRSWPARDVHRDLLVVRQGGLGAVPPDQRQARLLQRLLPHPARRLTHSLSVRADSRPAEPASIPTQVVSRPGSFDSGPSAAAGPETCCQSTNGGRTHDLGVRSDSQSRSLCRLVRPDSGLPVAGRSTLSRSGACPPAARGRTCAPCRGAAGRCCRRGPSRSARPRPRSR